MAAHFSESGYMALISFGMGSFLLNVNPIMSPFVSFGRDMRLSLTIFYYSISFSRCKCQSAPDKDGLSKTKNFTDAGQDHQKKIDGSHQADAEDQRK